MKKIFILFLLLFTTYVTYSQLRYDSIVVVSEGEKIYKTEYVLDGINFYKIDRINGGWDLYFQHVITADEKLYYKIDSLGDRTLIFRDIYRGDTIYSYTIDSIGDEYSAWTLITYPHEDVATSSIAPIENDEIITYSTNNKVFVESTKSIESINIVDISGRSVKFYTPHKKNVSFNVLSGFYLLKIKRNDGFFIKKIVVY